MKTKAIFFLTFFFLFVHVSAKQGNIHFNGGANDDWEVVVRMDSSITDIDAIQICIIESDPYVYFKKNFFTTSYLESIRATKNENDQTRIYIGHILYTWDKVLNLVKGSEMLLVTRKLSSVWSFSSTYELPTTKMWVISSVFYLDSTPYCYIIPIVVKNGTKLDIVLGNANRILMTDLTEL